MQHCHLGEYLLEVHLWLLRLFSQELDAPPWPFMKQAEYQIQQLVPRHTCHPFKRAFRRFRFRWLPKLLPLSNNKKGREKKGNGKDGRHAR